MKGYKKTAKEIEDSLMNVWEKRMNKTTIKLDKTMA